MEGPKVQARSAGAPKGWGLGRGAVAPPQYGVSGGYAPRKKFQKSMLKSRILRHFLQAEMVSSHSSAVAARQD